MLEFIIASLAVYRLSHMIVAEDGPFDIFTKWRSFLYTKDPSQQGWVARGFNCVLCVSFWVALVFVWLTGMNPILGVFGLSGATLLIHKVVYK